MKWRGWEFIAVVIVVNPSVNAVSSENALRALTRTWQQQLRSGRDPRFLAYCCCDPH
ncbi:hypothetical protein [Edaphovirga cremea]|uniref:hypothetical protein n=1 Tax=Edaphovirga cremea TaxID=2267246 RepID=UPI0013007B37|nr:hypothetical protein [Edaphovirga cremea]